MSRAFPFAFVLAAVAGSAGSSVFAKDYKPDEKQAVKLPSKELLHVYLLLGQGNMSGRGYVYKEDREHDKRIVALDREGKWTYASEPLHFDKAAGLVGVGPGMSFARAMTGGLPEGGVIALVPCAWEGSSLSRWEKGGDLYAQCIQRAKKAMKDGTLKGILWHQGETDAAQYTMAVTYGERLPRMVTDLRKDLGAGDVPFIAAKLNDLISAKRFPAVKMVNDGIDKLPKSVANTAVISGDNLDLRPDGVSIDTQGARELGKRYARTMRDMQFKVK